MFRRASETPLFRIIKDLRLARRQGAYAVAAANGAVLKRGHDLARVLDGAFARQLKLIDA